MDAMMRNDVERIGLDVGFGDTKAVAYRNGKLVTALFPSVVGLAQELSSGAVLGARKRAMRIEYNGAEYFVGQDALRHSRALVNRQDRQRIGSEQERVLALAALAQLGVTRAVIVTGLPVLWFGDRRALVKSLRGEHTIMINKQERMITIQAVVAVPQPFGGFYSHFLDEDGCAQADDAEMMRAYGFLDVGWNTTDMTAISGLQPVDKWSGGAQVGVRNLIAIVGDEITRKHGLAAEPHEIDQAIRDGYIEVFGQRNDLSALIKRATTSLANEIKARASDLWGNGERLAKVLIFGGGAAVMNGALRETFPHNSVLLDHPALSNAIGFCRFAHRQIWKE